MDNRPIRTIFENLIGIFPETSEEGGFAQSKSIEEMCSEIHTGTMLDREAIAIVIRMISLQFEKQGLLDPSELDSGNWRFVSFPASLHARSWLEVMRDPRGNWYPEGWWTDSSNEEDQRRILHEMEERRIGSRNVEPIRWVHVSWAIIKIDDRILMCSREDRERLDVPFYVLPGGRMNLGDIRRVFNEVNHSACLEALRKGGNSQIDLERIYPTVLERELKEELDLDDTDYVVSEALVLAPFDKLEGAGANHSMTRYFMRIFPIRLELSGLMKLGLLHHDKQDGNQFKNHKTHWFDLEEVTNSQSGDKRAFLEAWLRHYDDDKEVFLKELKEFPSSIEDNHRFEEPVDLPVDPENAITFGVTGSNQRFSETRPDETESLILRALGWHSLHGQEHSMEPSEGTKFGLRGWVGIHDDETKSVILELENKLSNEGLKIIEIHDRNWFRVSVPKGGILFQEEFFEYELHNPDVERWELILWSMETRTPLGIIPSKRFVCRLPSEKMFRFLKTLKNGEYYWEIYNDPQHMIRTTLDPKTREIGLRKFVRMVQGELQIACLEKYDD